MSCDFALVEIPCSLWAAQQAVNTYEYPLSIPYKMIAHNVLQQILMRQREALAFI